MHVLGLCPVVSGTSTVVSTPLGIRSIPYSFCQGCFVSIVVQLLPCEPVVLDMSFFDIILGMDWKSYYGAIIICDQHRVTLFPKSEMYVRFIFDRELPSPIIDPISGTFSCLFVDLSISDKGEAGSALPRVVSEFPNILPDDLSGPPPRREVEFYIDLVPGTCIISTTLYQLIVRKLEEMHIQFIELLSNDFIR